MQIVFATSNFGKAREAGSILSPAGFEIVTPPVWLGEVETGVTYLENARLKAMSAVRLTGKPVLAEDAGVEVDALSGLPGVRSARFAGPGADAADNNAKLLDLMRVVPTERRTARYRVAAVLLLPSLVEFVGEGTLEGRILDTPRGEGGFGYDPLFVPSGLERAVAEMRADEKNEISHRAQALREIVSQAREAGLLG